MRNILQLMIFLTASTVLAQLPQELLKTAQKTDVFDSYVGSVYTNKKYQNASIIAEKTGTFDAPVRYNIFNDALEYTEGSKLYEIVKTPTTHVRIGNDYFYYCNFKNERGFNNHGYFVLVELNEQYRIYKKYDLKIIEPKAMDANTGSAQIGKIKAIETYYLEENGTAIVLPTKKSEILAMFSDKKDELKDYIKKEKIKVRKADDLVKLVSKYNALKNIDANPSRSLLSNRAQNN
ncbi:hypothetical protein [Aquimarina sp. 2201CG14-23]|uniref:hypothetical protein n=1 Tax=Aquimarina mycalae TaxID=3040073 RepID=UPI002477DCBE|nr:hypothetical protein [Aquimarina sp. 2201CG14-23]MDH7445348.1 hypothetical protein [Aquimarina sp. 2201CG14-23]